MKKTLLTLTICTFLTACGGSSDSSNSQPNQPGNPSVPGNPGSKTGILTDSPIEGATYSINGVTAKTNAKGEFKYNEGDIISFKVGDIEVGAVKGAARITPVDLTNDEVKQLNLLILLQSLDDDGDHDNGIKLPEAVSSLAADAVNLSQPTAQFVSTLETELKTIPALANNTVVTAEKAKENFKATLLKDITGIWYVGASNSEESELALIIEEDGSYIMGEAIPSEPNNEGNGVEVGKISVDPLTGDFTVTVDVDTNDDWGLHDPAVTRIMNMTYNGVTLRLQEAADSSEGATFNRVPNTTSGLVGVWKINSGPQTFFFNSNNTYFMLDPSDADDCGKPGIEYGHYKVQDNKLFTTKIVVDTNGCAGLSNNYSHLGIPMSIQANTLTISVTDEGNYSFNRLNVAK